MTARKLFTLVMMALITALTAAPALADAPARIPVQGVMSNASGAAVNNTLPVRFALYTQAQGGESVWEEEQQITFDQGAFAASLGVVEALPLEIFRDEGSLWLGLKIGNDPETTRLALDTAPYAAFAQYAANADTADSAASLNGFEPEDFAAAEHDTPFDSIVDFPEDLADGDDDTTYTAGSGLQLQDGAFGLTLDCTPGQVLQRSDSGWDCQDSSGGGGDGDATDELISGVSLDGTTLTITDAGQTFTIDLSALQDGTDDADADPANETITAASLNGTALEIIEAGSTTSVDLSALQDGTEDDDADPANELISSVSLDGTTLTITDAGQTFTIDLIGLQDGTEDDDADPANEIITAAALNGTALEITEAGSTTSVDLSSLQDGTEDDDADPANELISGASLNGTALQITEAGATISVDLSALQDGTEDDDADATNELISGATLNGTALEITEAGATTSVDLSSLQDGTEDDDADATNELITGATLNGTALEITEAGDTTSIDLSGLQDGTEDDDADPANEVITAAALNGTALEITEAGSTTSVDLSSLTNTVPSYTPITSDSVFTSEYSLNVPGITFGLDGRMVACHDNKLTTCEDATCASFTSINLSGFDNDCEVTLGTAGNPIAVSRNNATLAICDDAACASPTYVTIDSNAEVASVALGSDGFPVVAYRNASDEVILAHCEDAACSTFSTVSLDSGDELAGQKISVVIGVDGYPLIAYTDAANDILKAVHCEDVACSAFSVQDLGSSTGDNFGGRFAQATLGVDGMPIIATLTSGEGLVMVHCDSIDCSSSTRTETGTSAAFPSIAIGADGLPIIARRSFNDNNLGVTRCLDVACTSVTNFEFIVSSNSGTYNAIGVDPNGIVHIVYNDASNGDRRLRRLPLGRGMRSR